MGSRSIVYVGIYALIYQHTILGERIVSRDELPRGVLPSGILKMRKKCPGLEVPCSIIFEQIEREINKEYYFSNRIQFHELSQKF